MFKGLGGLGDINKMLKQAQDVQQKMADVQPRLETLEVTGEAGAGLVQAVVNGKGQLKSVTIDPSLCTPEERGVVQDLLVAAVNDGQAKAQERAQAEMAAVAQEMSLPPGMMPGGRPN